jgi:hypothetical protein
MMTIQQDEDEQEPPLDPVMERVRTKMVRLLAISIAIMMAGLVAVLGAIVYRIGPGSKQETGSVVSQVPINPGVKARLDLPDGAKIQSVSLDGSNILLQLELPDGSRQLLIYGVNEGRVLGSIAVE